MRVFSHAILSLVRKPAKAIMIFVILLVVFALVFTGIIIQNSITRSKEYVRKGLGAIVEMRADYMKAMNDGLAQGDFGQLALSTSLAQELAKDPEVKALYISTMSSGSNPDLQSAQKAGTGTVMMAVGSGGQAFPIMGSNQNIPLEFEYGSLSLAVGRHRTDEDQGKNTLLISEELASKNNLSVGDQIELSGISGGGSLPFEVIGIFKGADTIGADMMYTSYDSAQALSGARDDSLSSTINFALKDPLQVEAFIDRHKEQLPSKYIYLYASDNEYKSLTRPLDLIATITSILLWVVFIAGALILIAIVTIFVRDRKFEIGLLLSSGEGKLKILSQFILEIMMVAVLAFLVAAGSSQLSSKFVADWIVENQLVEEEASAPTGMMTISLGGGVKNDVKISDVAQNFDVAVDQDTILNLVLLSFGLIVVSTGAPLMIILGYKPRESLQD